jgi:DHA1 family multidrug resistance protein-like MFS transporter
VISESWRRNLYVIAVAEFLVIMAFSFVTPFMPLFIQKLGNFTSQEAAFWAGIATGSSGIAMFLSAPVWGMLADRWGRKPMVLRAQFGGAIVLALAGLSPNVYCLIGLRFTQGLLSGTVAAASALVSAMTPRDRIPFAMGLLMLTVYGGSTLGPLLGGLMADIVGFRATFFITGALLFLGGLIVLLFVKESFEHPAEGQNTTLRDVLRLAVSREMLPLLMVISALNLAPQMVGPVIPLLVGGLSHEGASARTSGLAFGLMSLIAAISSFVAGRLARHIKLRTILVFSCVGTGLLYLPPIWAQTAAQLVILVGTTGLLTGGIITSANSLVGLSVPISQQGVAYGLSQSASSLGGGLGPLIGGSLASFIGFRPVFGVTGGFFILVGVAVTRLLVRRPSTA